VILHRRRAVRSQLLTTYFWSAPLACVVVTWREAVNVTHRSVTHSSLLQYSGIQDWNSGLHCTTRDILLERGFAVPDTRWLAWQVLDEEDMRGSTRCQGFPRGRGGIIHLRQPRPITALHTAPMRLLLMLPSSPPTTPAAQPVICKPSPHPTRSSIQAQSSHPTISHPSPEFSTPPTMQVQRSRFWCDM
jgi:hypothetical protein